MELLRPKQSEARPANGDKALEWEGRPQDGSVILSSEGRPGGGSFWGVWGEQLRRPKGCVSALVGSFRGLKSAVLRS